MQQHYETFAAAVAGLPQFVKDEFEAYLECGVLAHGCMRLHCDGCKHEMLVTFRCKRRGICPSCAEWRTTKTIAWLVDIDNVMPEVPVHQWVLSIPIPLHTPFAVHPATE